MRLTTCIVLTISSITFFASAFITTPTQASTSPQPTPQLLVINQTRGEECCDQGNLTALESQLNAAIATQIPAHFALRYDALTNPAYVKLLKTARAQHPDLFTFGALVEITPELASAAGVTYTGTPDTWFQAKHVLTMGYEPADRYKLLDAFWSEFRSQFGSYPTFSTAWMLDTPSLNYLHQTYNLQVHQITREQAGTDSYHLIGGPPHYPYPASANWLFIPDYERANAPLIVRQTVTDPLRNYGDTTNAFTSQPNDFRLDGKEFGYFEKLITQALFGSSTTPQYPTGFALIGLENSMPPQDQATFVKQLEYVAPWIREGKVSTPSVTELTTFWRNQPLSLYSGTDLITPPTGPDQTSGNNSTSTPVFWITTPQYRARLRHQDGKNFISDFRAFNATWQDPYTTHTATNQAIWIVPYVVDGSTWYDLKQQPTGNPLDQLKVKLTALFQPPTPPRFSPQPLPDTVTTPQQIQLPSTDTSFKLARASAEGLQLATSAEQLSFTQKTWTSSTPPQLVQPHSTTPPLWPTLVTLNRVCEAASNCALSLTTGTAETLNQTRQAQYPLLFPELTAKPIDLTKSIFYIHNRYAIAGRNPVRAVFMAVDELGYPSLVEPPPHVSIDSHTATITQSTDPKSSTITFIDIAAAQPQKINVELSLTSSTAASHTAAVTKTETVYLAPNCKTQLGYCLRHPIEAWWYLLTLLNTLTR